MAHRTHPTIHDVAKEAGVALGTVSNALNHPNKVRPGTLKRVREAATRLGYAPNQNARMLAGGRNRVFGLILPNLDHGISLQIANGATAEARKAGYSLLFATANNNDEVADSYRTYFMGTQVAGILIQPPAISGRALDVGQIPLPYVFLDVQSDQPGYYVAADNVAQGSVMAEHALACGARHVAVVGDPSLRRLQRRLDGIELALATAGSAQVEVMHRGAWNIARDGYDIGRELALRPAESRPDFILCLTDVLATGVVSGVRSAGASVPRDVRVAGCDGNPLAWSGPVPLTTIAPPGYEIGRRGVQDLLEQIEHAKEGGYVSTSDNHQQFVRPFLLARLSTGVNNGSDFADPDLDISGYL
ncbi:MAG: LacI family DNA-binding transcriptional regulator [Coriobacteriaceae bacterium]|nr:LacI family DNA-binding transcriptional regulator [Coriobacteriaceae bacterium]